MQKASMGRRGENKNQRGEEGRGSNIKIHENVLLVGYKTKDANPLLPVRSSAKKRSMADVRGGQGINEGRSRTPPKQQPPFSSVLPISFMENTENTVTRRIWRSSMMRL